MSALDRSHCILIVFVFIFVVFAVVVLVDIGFRVTNSLTIYSSAWCPNAFKDDIRNASTIWSEKLSVITVGHTSKDTNGQGRNREGGLKTLHISITNFWWTSDVKCSIEWWLFKLKAGIAMELTNQNYFSYLLNDRY